MKAVFQKLLHFKLESRLKGLKVIQSMKKFRRIISLKGNFQSLKLYARLRFVLRERNYKLAHKSV